MMPTQGKVIQYAVMHVNKIYRIRTKIITYKTITKCGLDNQECAYTAQKARERRYKQGEKHTKFSKKYGNGQAENNPLSYQKNLQLSCLQ